MAYKVCTGHPDHPDYPHACPTQTLLPVDSPDADTYEYGDLCPECAKHGKRDAKRAEAEDAKAEKAAARTEKAAAKAGVTTQRYSEGAGVPPGEHTGQVPDATPLDPGAR
jgi:hypothetical protein